MTWLVFLASAAVLVFAATKLAESGDAIAARTGLSQMFVGTLLLAAATSLPEFLTTINSLSQGVPDMAAGNLLGSSMFNMFLLGVLDLLGRQARILRRVATRHALSAGLAIALTTLVVFFILAGIDIHIGWVGLDSLLVVALYIAGVWLIRSNNPVPSEPPTEPELEGVPSLPRALISFALATGAMLLVTPWLVRSGREIAEITGLGAGFIGTALLAIVTSLPEVATSITAVRLGAYDLAVGNLFGSNAFNMFALGLADVFYTQGRFLGAIAPEFALVGLLGLLLTSLGLIGNLTRLERRLLFVEVDALAIILLYFAGMWFLFSRGIG